MLLVTIIGDLDGDDDHDHESQYRLGNYIYIYSIHTTVSLYSVQKYWIGYPEAFCTEVPNLSSGISYLTYIKVLILMTINEDDGGDDDHDHES